MTEAKQALILCLDTNSPMGFGDVEHQSGQRFVGRAERKAFAVIRQGRIRSLVGEMRVRSNTADRAVHDQAGRTVRGDYYPQLAYGSVAVTARKFSIASRNRADPEFGCKQTVNKVSVIEG